MTFRKTKRRQRVELFLHAIVDVSSDEFERISLNVFVIKVETPLGANSR